MLCVLFSGWSLFYVNCLAICMVLARFASVFLSYAWKGGDWTRVVWNSKVLLFKINMSICVFSNPPYQKLRLKFPGCRDAQDQESGPGFPDRSLWDSAISLSLSLALCKYIHVYTYIYIYIYTHTYMCICIHTRIGAYVSRARVSSYDIIIHWDSAAAIIIWLVTIMLTIVYIIITYILLYIL